MYILPQICGSVIGETPGFFQGISLGLSRVAVQINGQVPVGPHNCLLSRSDTQFAQDLRDVTLHGLDRQVQLPADVRVAQPL
jgi:hypothetical protein